MPAGALDQLGLAIFTTRWTRCGRHAAEAGLAAGVDAHEGWRGRGRRRCRARSWLLDPATGEVRALVGGRDPGRGDFNRATQALRQPGSAIKPVVYAAALDPRRGGERFTPGSTVPDLRREFATPEGPWRPRNDEGDYHESVTLAKALAKSLNVATANLVERIGAGTVARYAERFGLGAAGSRCRASGSARSEVTLLALVSAPTRRSPTAACGTSPRRVRAVLDGRGRRAAGAGTRRASRCCPSRPRR